ncbi:MAG TPA: SAM-dependent methyltransferase, partial [Beijerinckiaceae bacterium]
MTPLGAEIAALVAAGGPISFERYMELCLAHPQHGYYMTRDPFGAAGDFVTAPEISQMFGELVGAWAAIVWRQMGEPRRVTLAELGPGRGTLMADALRACRAIPGFLAALDVRMVETSPLLRARQAEKLQGVEAAVEWCDSVEDLPPGPLIAVANEFFDALPVRHYVRGSNGWYERLVGVRGAGELVFGLSPAPEPALRFAAPAGTVLEIGAAAHRVMAALAARLVAQGGAALVIDYGHVETALGETAQAMRGHAAVGLLDDPGECDLTAHVDFASLARAARASGARVHGPVTQAELLKGLGVYERATQLKRSATP